MKHLFLRTHWFVCRIFTFFIAQRVRFNSVYVYQWSSQYIRFNIDVCFILWTISRARICKHETSFNLCTVTLSLNKYTLPIYLNEFVVESSQCFQCAVFIFMGFCCCCLFRSFSFLSLAAFVFLFSLQCCFCNWVFKLFELLRSAAHNTSIVNRSFYMKKSAHTSHTEIFFFFQLAF